MRILHTDQNKWKRGSERFDFPSNVTRFRLEFVCFVGDKSENLDVDISAILFDAKVCRLRWGEARGLPHSVKGIQLESVRSSYRLPGICNAVLL